MGLVFIALGVVRRRHEHWTVGQARRNYQRRPNKVTDWDMRATERVDALLGPAFIVFGVLFIVAGVALTIANL